MRGSRDVGAQLFCAMLRGAGVRTRLVCSFQPLSVDGSGPVLKVQKTPGKSLAKKSVSAGGTASVKEPESLSLTSPLSARRRLGHPDAASFHFKPPTPSRVRTVSAAPTQRQFPQSKYPIYWVEILDVGYQKWRPLSCYVASENPLFWDPKHFEPPLHDSQNVLSYVVAFDADGTARDVTRRYAKAYNAKTRKLRIDNSTIEGGDKFWRKALKRYKSIGTSDLDQIEENELTALTESEPMPKNIVDFKDHPLFALERHLRRNEVLIPDAIPSGTVRASRTGPVEKIYRRKHIRIARTVDKWFRQGREVKPMEIPVKWLPPKRTRPKGNFPDSDEEDDPTLGGTNGQPVFTIEQTTLYEPPPIRDGKVPKTEFNNIEIYVPSMVPRGGRHIRHPLAKLAAHLVGIDYAPALTGFSFQGRKGTAVLDGVVIAEEYAEAVTSVITGLEVVKKEEEEDEKRMALISVWRRWLMGLRIRESIWEGAGEEERREAEREIDRRVKEKGYEDEGGFLVEGGGGGGFMVEGDNGGFVGGEADVGGGFVPDIQEPEDGGFVMNEGEAMDVDKGKEVDTQDAGGGGGGFEKWLQDDDDDDRGVGEEQAQEAQSDVTEEYVIESDDDDDDDMAGGFMAE